MNMNEENIAVVMLQFFLSMNCDTSWEVYAIFVFEKLMKHNMYTFFYNKSSSQRIYSKTITNLYKTGLSKFKDHSAVFAIMKLPSRNWMLNKKLAKITQ